MSSRPYPANEGLQVVDSSHPHGLEVAGSNAPEVVPGEASLYQIQQGKQAVTGHDSEKEVAPGGSERRGNICGLRRRTFWILLGVVCLIVIAAAVGGGVGGALSNKHSR